MKFERKQGTKTSFLLIAANVIDNRIAPENKQGNRVINHCEVYPPERAIKMNANTYLKNSEKYISKLEYFNIDFPTYSIGDIQGTNDLLIFNLENDILEVYILENKKPFISEVKGLFENEAIFDYMQEAKSEKPIININRF
jgi:hypothetical protein